MLGDWLHHGDFLRTKDNSLLICAIPVIRKTCFFLSELVYFLQRDGFCLTCFDLFKFIVNYSSLFVTCVTSNFVVYVGLVFCNLNFISGVLQIFVSVTLFLFSLQFFVLIV